MRIIEIDKDTRKCLPSNITIGYLEENYTEKLQFIIPEEYKNYGKKALFQTKTGETFSMLFDNDTIVLSSGITKYKELDLTIEFFKTENEKQIIAKSSMLHITINDSVLDTDISPDEPEVNIIDDLINKVSTSINEVNNLNITTERVDDGVNIKMVDKQGVETITKVKDGEKGEKGDKGDKGEPGKDGSSFIDLQNYYTKDEVNTELNTKQNKLIPGDGVDIDSDNTINVTDVLFTDNTTPYTPQNDYNPSTKKYVDDSTNDIKKYVDDSISNIQVSDATYVINTQTSEEEKLTIMQEVYDKYTSGNIPNLTYVDISGNVFSLFDVDKFDTHIDFFMINGGTATTNYGVGYYAYDRYKINCTYTDDTITKVSIEELSDTYMLADNSEILGINNQSEYTPTTNYQPATKKYVDDSIENIDVPSVDLGNYYTKSEVDNAIKVAVTGSLEGSY